MLAKIRSKNLQYWLPGYARFLVENALPKRVVGPRHLLFAFCDHFEPLRGRPPVAVGDARVETWERDYPKLAGEFRDAEGRPPQHSFFFPGEEYQPSYLERLATLVRGGFGEVELHLHHDGDTADNLRYIIGDYLKKFSQHGHVSRAADGEFRYAFIHGNWCLANARKDGRMCGVNEEIPLLFDTGCYADFTFPAAPNDSQPNIVNQIYWPDGDLARRRAYEQGVRARVGEVKHDRLLMIEGPLALARRPGRLMWRIENAAVAAHDPASETRVRTWVDQGIHVEGRPEWVFVKIHTHGASEDQAASALGEGGRALHRALARYNDGRRWQLHYVTAREMYNIAIAAMEGRSGNPTQFRDHVIQKPPVSQK